MRLAGCSGCGRHIRTSEIACPFCGAAAASMPIAVDVSPARPLSRAAILFASATAIAGCGKTTNESVPAPAYGGPPVMVEAGPAPIDTGMMTAPAYGVPAPPPEVAPPSSGSATPNGAGSTGPQKQPPKKK